MDNALPITNALPISNALPIMAGANILPEPPLSYSYAAPVYTAPVYAGCYPARGCGFILIVVLFILLIIVGAVCFYG